MKVRMKVGLSGGRGDGRPWPMPGVGDDTIDVGDREGMELCAAGLAVPVTDDEDEPETRPDKAAAEKRGDPNAPVFDTISASGGAVAAAAQDAARATSGKSAAATTVTPAAMTPKAAPGSSPRK